MTASKKSNIHSNRKNCGGGPKRGLKTHHILRSRGICTPKPNIFSLRGVEWIRPGGHERQARAAPLVESSHEEVRLQIQRNQKAVHTVYYAKIFCRTTENGYIPFCIKSSPSLLKYGEEK